MMEFSTEPPKSPNPKDKANIFSRFSFLYTYDLFRQGYKKELHEFDLYQVTKECKSKDMGDQMESQWKNECKNHKSPSLYRLLWRCYGKRYLALGILQLIVKSLTMLLTILCVERIVKHFRLNEEARTKDRVILFACLLVAVRVFEGFYTNNYKLALIELGMRVRTALCSLIYRKCLRMTSSALSEFSTGKVVTLITKDVYYVDTAVVFMNEIWISSLHLCFMTYLLYSKIGLITFTGIGFILLSIVVEVIIGKITGNMRVKTSRETDLRLHMTHELLSAIKMIKMYTWGHYFCEKISRVRKREIKFLRKVFYLNAITACLGTMCTKIAFYFLFISYVNGKTYMPPEIIYFTKTCFKYLTMVIMSIPFGIVQCASLYAAEKRITKFLKAEELSKCLIKFHIIEKPKIILQDVSVIINNSKVLKDINLTCENGLYIISGANGSGKSTLLKTILSEYNCIKGRVDVKGTVSYVPEEPWLFPGTIRENIIFGERFDGRRYQRVLEVCSLKFDLALMTDGDHTIIKDRGMNLSRGQQCRISLARAIYRDTDIYLMDECLSSLDNNVQDYIFNQCIKEFLDGKICILVTNNPKFFKHADELFLMKNGANKSLKPAKSLEFRISRYIDEGEEKDNLETKPDVIKDIHETDDTVQLIPKNGENYESNIYYEVSRIGKVKTEVYKKYFAFGGSLILRLLLILLFFVDQGTINYNDKLVSQWVNNEQLIMNYKSKSNTSSTKFYKIVEENKTVFKLYSVLIIVSIVLVLLRSMYHFFLSTRISYRIHKSMIKTVVNATMEFFDQNLIGNILNRFSKDLVTVDEKIPYVLYECLRMTSIILCTAILIACVKIILLVPLLVLFFFMYVLRKYYLPTGRSLKRLECTTRSPMVGHLNASLEGVDIIRNYGKAEMMREEFDRHQDLYTSAYHSTQTTSRAFGWAVDMVSAVFVAAILVQSLLKESGTLAGDIGLVILQAITLTKYLEFIIQEWAELEYQMTSAERVIDYTEIKTENKQGKILDNWPKEGTIEYKAVSLSYNQDEQKALKDINLGINPQEKIGIIGRTGAGKSSLVSALFRLYEICGRISIDGVDIRTVSLNILRSKIAIIPQNPLLFNGTIRSNIDPYHHYTDEEIWKAIDMIGIKDLVKDLTNMVTDGGSQFSAGQKQLLCLVRALVQKNKIIVLDEATGSVDPEASKVVNAVIQERFKSCTVLTIAHRLETVMNSDRIMIIDQGRIIEYDTPSNLLNNINSRYRELLGHAL